MNRTIHRWASLPIAIVMLVVAVSGAWLQLYEFEGSGGPEGNRDGRTSAAAAQIPTDEEAVALLARALAAARAERPDFEAQSVTVTLRGGEPAVTLAGSGGRRAPTITYDSSTDSATYSPPPPASIRGIMIGLHTGRTGGLTGLVLVMAAGIVLTVLSVTGFIVYLDMWNRRRKAGKRALFW